MRKSEFRFPPPVESPDSESLKDFEPLTRSERRKLIKSERTERYTEKLRKYQTTQKDERRALRSAWWWSKGIQILLLILATISAVCSVISILR